MVDPVPTFETVVNGFYWPVPLDGLGATLDPAAWGTADVTEASVAGYVDGGWLLVCATPDPVPEGINPDAAAAFATTLSARAAQVAPAPRRPDRTRPARPS